MGRLEELFNRKNKNILNVYCTAGFPEYDSTVNVMKALQASGADIIELGIPYSDPLADGPVIQESSAKALANGMTISKLFKQLNEFRKEITLPVVFMGYANPVFQFGFEAFCKRCFEIGIDGLIIPDIPMYEYETQYRSVVERYNLDFIFLITPETGDERIKKLDSLSSGFLYAVSSSSITGSDKSFSDVENYLKRLQNLKLENPVLVGFGIKDKSSFETVCKYANGAIIGTAYINAIKTTSDIERSTKEFLKQF